ncbi:serine/threonine-protein kinase SIK2-like [Gigantopelta aegis]|uniref:serine/threonine-protein kinase SIK2-like n=1 Tax=Gigantopelta aegis TaxID=1735272 RepID=UPI001B88C6F5|nr:serine/threonine-protein kinase SIK2-like [Gigantopelta aegis]
MNSLLKLYSSVTSATALPPHLTQDCLDVLKGMMTIDPTRRLTSAQVVQHAWLKTTTSRETRTGESAGNIDFELLHAICRKYKYAYRDVYESVIDNKCNHYSAIYHVSLAARRRDGDHGAGGTTLGKTMVNSARNHSREWCSEISDGGTYNRQQSAKLND